MNTSIWNTIKNIVRLRSLRARIFIIILIIGIVPSILMRYGIVENYEERAVQNRITTVQNQLMIIANHLINNNYLTVDASLDSSRAVINAELETIATLYDGRVQVI
ncbi:MAG: two-component sensor histidine kinase, partial [Clostridium sp.]|nr:two-component sensor histidine kinase [Clostridium sp.]